MGGWEHCVPFLFSEAALLWLVTYMVGTADSVRIYRSDVGGAIFLDVRTRLLR